MQINWPIPKYMPTLPNNIIHIWAIALDDPEINTDAILNALWQLLASDEQQRAMRFAFPQLRKKFIITRGILRILLAHYLQLRPQEILLQKTSHGKLELLPSISNGNILQFNLSHSKDLTLMAFSWQSPVGIDVEFINRKANIIEIAERFFHQQETQAILALPDNTKRTEAFFNCWTRKEAFIKALGLGLAYPLNNFAVEIHDNIGKTPIFIKLNIEKNTDKPLPQHNWQLFALPSPAQNYTGAFAIGDNEKIQANQIIQYCFTSSLAIKTLDLK